jgi:hypothetical protein
MNLLQHFSLLLLVMVSMTSGVFGGGLRGREQDLRRLRITCHQEAQKDFYGRMKSSKSQARERQGSRKSKSTSVSDLHRNQLLQGKIHQDSPFY